MYTYANLIVISSEKECPHGDDQGVHYIGVVRLSVAGERTGMALGLVCPELEQRDVPAVLVFAGGAADGAPQLSACFVLLQPPTQPCAQPGQLALTVERIVRENQSTCSNTKVYQKNTHK